MKTSPTPPDATLPAMFLTEGVWCLYDGIAMFDQFFARGRQIYLTHLADALARPGKQRDLEAAADRGLAAVHLAEGLTSHPRHRLPP